MHSPFERISTILANCSSFILTGIPILTLGNIILSYFSTEPIVNLSVEAIRHRPGIEDHFMNRNVRLTDFSMNLDADFNSCFHWNMKQLFLYAVISYENENYSRNEIVIWDRILQKGDSKRISISGMRNKYPVTDISDNLPGTNATISLRWNFVPFVGPLTNGKSKEKKIMIPEVGEPFIEL